MSITIASHGRAGIATKYYGPTNYRPSRIRVRRTDHDRTTDDKQLWVSYDPGLSAFDNHAQAARQLIEHYGWDGRYSASALDNGYVFTPHTI